MSDVLVVDDDLLLLRIYRACLGLRGHRVHTASTVAEAGKQVADITPDAVLLDLHLPDGDGMDLVAAIRQRSPRCRILVFTSTGVDPSSLMARGVDHILAKHSNGPAQVGRAVDALLAEAATPGPAPSALRPKPPRLRPAGCAAYPQWRAGLARALHDHQGLHEALQTIINGLDSLRSDQVDPALIAIATLARQLYAGTEVVQASAMHSLLAVLDMLHLRCTYNLPPPRLSGRRVLLVDDQALSLRLLATALADLDLELAPARSTEEALQVHAHKPAELVFTDVRMPGDSGVVLAKQLSTTEQAPRIVLISAMDSFERDFLPGHHIQAVIQKPFLHAEVAVTAVTQLGRRDLDRFASAQDAGSSAR